MPHTTDDFEVIIPYLSSELQKNDFKFKISAMETSHTLFA